MKLRQALKGKLSKKELDILKTAFDVVGGIAILEIEPELEKKEKIIAQTLLDLQKNIKTVVKKVGIHTGKFRLQKLKIIAGKRKKETIHKENMVRLKLNVEKVYFSPRMATERKRIMEQVKPGEEILIMFSGCAPYPCVLAKNTKAKEIYGVEINPAAHKYALENIKLNKLNNVRLIHGDVRKVMPKLNKKFDRIAMPLPMGGEDFLDIALSAAKKGTIMHFYDFLREEQIPKTAYEKIKNACKEAKKKCRIISSTKCGQYAPRTFRVCVDFKVL